jgi:hypothetical protein
MEAMAISSNDSFDVYLDFIDGGIIGSFSGACFFRHLFWGRYFIRSVISAVCFVVSFIESTHFSKSKSRCFVLNDMLLHHINTISHPYSVQLEFSGLLSEQEGATRCNQPLH